MKQFLRIINNTEEISESNRFTYITGVIGLVQVSLFLVLFMMIDSPILLIIQTVLADLAYVIGLLLLKKNYFCLSKNIFIVTMAIQSFLLVWIWLPIDTYLFMYYFIVPAVTFMLFDLTIEREKKSLITINTITSLLILTIGIIKPYQLISLNSITVEVFKFTTIISTFVAEILVFYFYAHNLSTTHKELQLLANTDGLTNIANRRVLFAKGQELFDAHSKNKQPFMLMILDIDFFKSINDQYGHPIGDKILKEVSSLISSTARKDDLLCRYGGEEFAIIFRNIDYESSKRISSIRDKITDHHFYISKCDYISVTFSAGVVTCDHVFSNFDDMVISADKLLYKAKSSGRNRIVLGNGDVIA